MLTTPQQILNHFKKKWPSYDKMVQVNLSSPGFQKLYPHEFIFLPLEAWAYVVEYGKKSGETLSFNNDKEQSDFLIKVIPLLILGTWSYSKKIYRFNEDLYKELKNTSFNDSNIPSSVLKTLPYHAIYIETPDYFFNKERLYGFFATLAYSFTDKTNVLYFHLIFGEFSTCYPVLGIEEEKCILLDKYIGGTIDVENDNYITDKESADFSFLLSLLLYICSENDKFSNQDAFPSKKLEFKKVKDGLRLFQPSQEKIIKIGDKEGEIIRKFREEEIQYPDGTKKRPHMRRAHWHGYWTGKRDSQEFKYNWIPPTFVNNIEDEIREKK